MAVESLPCLVVTRGAETIYTITVPRQELRTYDSVLAFVLYALKGKVASGDVISNIPQEIVPSMTMTVP